MFKKLLSISLAAAFISPAQLFGAETRPNVLLILADDLGYYDLGCYGVQDYET